jgi:hypothetical protein
LPARAFLGQAPPASVAHACRTVAEPALTYEIDIGVVFVGWPMLLEIIEESGPIRLQTVRLEIAQRKRKTVIDTGQRGRLFGQPWSQPFGDAAPRPVFARRRWRHHLDGRRLAFGQIDA